MKALILAAGRGTRVQPLTRSIPKPMLPILDSGCVIEGGAEVIRSLIFPYTRVGAHAHLENSMACGSYCVKVGGAVLDIARTDLGWVLSGSPAPIVETPAPIRGLPDLIAASQKGESA